MRERLTKEREAEIREAVQSGNENAGRARLETWCGDLLAEIDALRAAYEAERAARVALEARLTRERDEAIAKRDATAAVLMRQAERAEAADGC